MVYDFYGSNYASCLSRLQRMLPALRLDLHLSSHLEKLYASVRPALTSTFCLKIIALVLFAMLLHLCHPFMLPQYL